MSGANMTEATTIDEGAARAVPAYEVSLKSFGRILTSVSSVDIETMTITNTKTALGISGTETYIDPAAEMDREREDDLEKEILRKIIVVEAVIETDEIHHENEGGRKARWTHGEAMAARDLQNPA